MKSSELWLWVVMEYMEGGALMDIIENNTLDEDQISGICLEAGISFDYLYSGLCFDLFFSRHVKDWHIHSQSIIHRYINVLLDAQV